MADSGRYKWGDSKELGDQALELMGAFNDLTERYTNSESYKDALKYMDDEEVSMMNEIFELFDRSELLVIKCSDRLDQMNHKLDRIEKMLKEIYDAQ